MQATFNLFATAPKGIEPLLAEELQQLGATAVHISRGGVAFQGTLVSAYRACLWSRTANRILLPLAGFPAADPEALYQGVYTIPWEEHLAPDGTLAVDFNATSSQITHTQFGAQKVKDAIVDRLREHYGRRPSVERQRPDVRLNCYLHNDQATVYLDLSGDSLHKRGYREETVIAPLKENLAAALLLKANWPAIAAAGGPLLDPLCGSGTLPIEAALLAADSAPGLFRQYWGFLGWRQHAPALWTALLAEARQRREQGLSKVPLIMGYDHDPCAIRGALANAGRAGVQSRVHLECRELSQAEPPRSATSGLVIVNPPYGERLGAAQELESLYAQLGDWLKAHCQGWQAAVFTGNPELGKRMGLRARKVNAFYNGALPCKLLSFSVEPEYFVDREALDARLRQAALQAALEAGAAMFANRLRKNLHHLERWARREKIGCYRLYDADIPEYAVAVDIYEHWVHVQEYEAPVSIDPEKAKQRLEQVMAVIPAVLEIPPERVFLKLRRRQRGSSQYQKQASQGRFYEVHEGPCRFLVNFSDYLDTGLFLDHRLTRRLLGELARGRRFLNLFAYTGTATVYAALGGAWTTTTVDRSPTYLDWTQRHLELNDIRGRRQQLIQADCLHWLDSVRERFDLIFLDPPTFSNSKQMEGTFDVQRDQVELIRKAVRRLDPSGILIFSTNNRRFKLDQEALADLHIEDITPRTIPKDFERNPRIHQCWRIEQAQ
jgi:23S rRNA (guanine2445-N2)-methyltransferase / 23S rRNA (guanine2069-N7)-methyltransferase